LKFLKKIKKSEKYVKKIDKILRSLVKKFLQISDVLLVKIQNESNMTNGPTWPTAHMEAISSPSVGKTEVSWVTSPSARAGDGRRRHCLEITGVGAKFGRIGVKFNRMGR
jgi:hypothetical protein